MNICLFCLFSSDLLFARGATFIHDQRGYKLTFSLASNPSMSICRDESVSANKVYVRMCGSPAFSNDNSFILYTVDGEAPGARDEL